MVIRVVEQTVRRVAVSLPYAAHLIDGTKYMEPADVRPPQDDTELRRRAPRGPSLRYLVKLALRCESAEELGKRLRRRFQRQGLVRPDRGRAEGASADQLDKLLGQG